MEYRIATLIDQEISKFSPVTAPPPRKEQPPKLAGYFDGYAIAGPGWNHSERTFTSACKVEVERMAAEMRAGAAGWMLSLLGQTSAGKTMLARLLLRFWNLHVPPARYTGSREVVFHNGAWIDWTSRDWQQIEDERSAPFMVIDEAGRGERGAKGVDWESLRDILSYRLSRKVWTVVTSNLTWDEIRAQDPAIASRLRRNNGVVLQAGSDVRPFEDRETPPEP